MTNQEVLTTVVLALRKQGGPSTDGLGTCMYRGTNGRRCAAGVLLMDEFYEEELEGMGAGQPGVGAALLASGLCPEKGQLRLVVRLQSAHDTPARMFRDDSEWLVEFERLAAGIAYDYDLVMP